MSPPGACGSLKPMCARPSGASRYHFVPCTQVPLPTPPNGLGWNTIVEPMYRPATFACATRGSGFCACAQGAPSSSASHNVPRIRRQLRMAPPLRTRPYFRSSAATLRTFNPVPPTKIPGTLSSPGFSVEDGLAVTYFRMRDCTLSSAQTRFTVLFGMGKRGCYGRQIVDERRLDPGQAFLRSEDQGLRDRHPIGESRRGTWRSGISFCHELNGV